VMHNDDTSMRVLKMEREPGDDHTGVFTSGIVSTRDGGNIALCFSGRQHAGENLGDVLKQRVAELPAPIQMCDALSRNAPKLAAARRFCWPIGWLMDEGSLWTWRRCQGA